MRSLWLVIRGQERWADVQQRISVPNTGASIWVHGASVGELNAARPIIAALSGPVWVTTNTVTGRDTVVNWALPHVTATLAPIDFAYLARQAMRMTRALIVIENELWPNRLSAARRVGIPVVLLGARMSARSAATWKRLSGLAEAILSPVVLAVPQDAASAQRLEDLGVDRSKMLEPIALKSAYARSRSATPDLLGWDRSKTILAASTHAGEEELVLRAFAAALTESPDLRLILAPRHPERADMIKALIETAGLTHTSRSDADSKLGQVFLADTLGEMDAWYRAAGVAFIGGSLVDRGGHTPFEPIAYGCPIIHGPFVRNFAEIYNALDAAGGAVCVANTKELARAMQQHLGHKEMAQIATNVAPPLDLAPLISRIKSLVH